MPRSTGRAPQDRWSLVAVAGLLSFVAMLDMSIVNVALADIGTDLGAPPRAAQWAVLGYQLPVVALLLPVGRWLDRTAIRPVLLSALAGFAVCSAAAALAPGMVWLVAARLAQGAFGAALFVLMPVLATRAVRPEVRGRAMSVPATLGPLGAVSGPALGGLLTDQFGWRAVLLVKLPLCLVAWLVARAALPREGAVRAPGRREAADTALVAVAVAVVLLALTLAPGSPWWAAAALLAVVPAVLWARGPGGRPVVAVLRGAGTTPVHGAVLAVGAAFAAMHYVTALHLQRDSGLSASATGLTLLAFPAGMALAGPLGGRLADRFGPRPVAVTGSALVAAGFVLLAAGSDGAPPDLAWRLALAGTGMGLYGGPSQFLVMKAVAPEHLATAGSTVQLARSLGFTLGPALATAAWGVAGSADTGARAALVVAAVAACSAVPLLAYRPGRKAPEPVAEQQH
ncbi:MFS transporter [Streptomyces sp. NPDC047108]|uniref:MFS transporter n=1 Tax=Streptomyces sp. NPDC047108 TaxID=3155025 RepID=UPI0033D4E26A